MTCLSKVLFIATASLAVIGGNALADDAPAPDAGGGDAAGGAAGAAGGAAAAMPAGDDAGGGAWPMAIIDRPFNVNKGMIGVAGDLGIVHISLLGASSTGESLALQGDYGVTDKIAVGVGYAFALNPNATGKGPLNVHALLRLMHEAKMSAAVTAQFSYDLNDPNPVAIGAGLAFRYNVAPKFAVYTPGNQFAIGLSPSPAPIVLTLPFGAAVQATPNVYAFVQSSIGNIAISNAGDSTFFGKDFIPLTIGGFFSPSNKLDIGADISFPDVKNSAGDFWQIDVVVRFFKI